MAENLLDTNVGNIEYIRKQDASEWLKQYGQDVLHGKYKFSLMYIWKNIMDLPSADVVPYSIDPDGTLTITVPKGTTVSRVLVQEDGTQWGGLYYAD